MSPLWQPPRQDHPHAAIIAGCSIDDFGGPRGAAYLVLGTLDLVTKRGRYRQSLRRAFEHTRSSLRSVDHLSNPEMHLIEDLLEAGAATCQSRNRVLAEYTLTAAFGAYALHLTDHDRIAAAVDVLETEWRILGRSNHRREVGRELGTAYIRAGRLRTAAALARALARDRTRHVRCTGRIAAADIMLASGRYEAAERRLTIVQAEAERRSDHVNARAARLGRARALRPLGQPLAAALLLWEPDGDLIPAQVEELTACLEAAELWEPARRMAGWGALGYASPKQRWHALAAAVRISAHLGDKLALGRWVNWGERMRERGLPGPLARARYDAEVARARARPGGADTVANVVAPPPELATILAWIERMGEPWAVVQPRAG